MDEGDGGLDNANIKNVIRFIRTQADAMKFITITSRKSMYVHVDFLIGITTQVS